MCSTCCWLWNVHEIHETWGGSGVFTSVLSRVSREGVCRSSYQTTNNWGSVMSLTWHRNRGDTCSVHSLAQPQATWSRYDPWWRVSPERRCSWGCPALPWNQNHTSIFTSSGAGLHNAQSECGSVSSPSHCVCGGSGPLTTACSGQGVDSCLPPGLECSAWSLGSHGALPPACKGSGKPEMKWRLYIFYFFG